MKGLVWLAGAYLVLLGAVALLADHLASPLPYRCIYRGEVLYPHMQPDRRDTFWDTSESHYRLMFYREVNWTHQEITSARWAPVPYDVQPLNGDHPMPPDTLVVPPGLPAHVPAHERRFAHRLGTTRLGLDLLAGLLHGTRVTLGSGLLATACLALLGIALGLASGYWGDTRLHLPRGSLVVWGLLLLPAWYYSIDRRSMLLELGTPAWTWLGTTLLWLAVWGMLAYVLGRLAQRSAWGAHPVPLALDTLISKLIEVLDAMPALLVVLAVMPIFENRSVWLLALVVGMTSWTGIARLLRAECIRVREADYVLAAQALGLPGWRIILRHVLPNAIGPVLVALASALGSAMLIESAFSFLQVVEESNSWGSLMRGAYEHEDAWWLVVYPGLALMLTVLSVNILGEHLRDRLDRQGGDRPPDKKIQPLAKVF